MPTIAIVLNWRRRPDKRVTELLIEKCLLEYVYGYYENIAGTEKEILYTHGYNGIHEFYGKGGEQIDRRWFLQK